MPKTYTFEIINKRDSFKVESQSSFCKLKVWFVF